MNLQPSTEKMTVHKIQPVESQDCRKMIRPLFQQTTGELKVIVDCQINQDHSQFQLSVQKYQQDWKKICHYLRLSSQQASFLEVSLLFINRSTESFKQLKSSQLMLLNQWHDLFNRYLTVDNYAPIFFLLQACINDNAWIDALPIKHQLMVTPSLNTPLINKFHHQFKLLIHLLPTGNSNQQAFNTALTHHYLKFKQIRAVCHKIGLQGLAEVFHYLLLNIQLDSENKCHLDQQQQRLFNQTLALITAYLLNITDEKPACALVKHLQKKTWKAPLNRLQVQLLTTSLLLFNQIPPSAKPILIPPHTLALSLETMKAELASLNQLTGAMQLWLSKLHALTDDSAHKLLDDLMQSTLQMGQINALMDQHINHCEVILSQQQKEK